jgi:hypothetical protein
MTTYTARQSADWDGPWLDAGETLDEAEAFAATLGVPGSPTTVTIRNGFNHSAAKYDVYQGRAAFLCSAPDWTEDVR